MAKSVLLKSSLAKKYWMAATGLFLCTFLIAHMVGNLQLLLPGFDGKLKFNNYAVFMTTFPPIKILSYLTYFSILFHAVDGLLLTLQNRAARPVKYVYERPEVNSLWASRNMMFLGTIMFAFIVFHMSDFWYEYKFGELPYMTSPDGAPYTKMGAEIKGAVIENGMVIKDGENIGPAMKDLHKEVMEAFKQPALVVVYILAMIAIAFHLWHGFASAFQSFGFKHPKYNSLIETSGKAFAILVPLGFVIIPIYVFLFL
jgi:succinate dehydrogenase / fumarate reductase cytochrome b subunit